MNILSRIVQVIKDNMRAYITINVIYYGLVIFGMIYVSYNPSLQQGLLKAVGVTYSQGPLSSVWDAYSGGHLLSAILLTFVINLFLGSLLFITLPSLVIPFAGLPVGAYRAILWGLLLSPAEASLSKVMIPHSLTLLLEGQGYILAMLGAYLLWRNFLWPRMVGVEGHAKGYLEGLKQTGLLYIGVTIVLAVAAIYEALEAILIVPLLI